MSEVLQFNGIELPVAEQMKFYDTWGSQYAYNHMAVPWAWAFDTPYKWTKQVPASVAHVRYGDLLAGAHYGQGRHPQPVPPRHRHRADNTRSDRYSGTGDG